MNLTGLNIIAHIARLKESGDLKIDGTEIVGVASDGTEVSLGDTREMAAFHRYLRANPTPDTW